MTRTKVIHELWRRGIVAQHYLKPHQQELYKLIQSTVNDIVVPNISRRFGKTTTCVVYAIERCLQRPNSTVRYATAYLTDLTEFLKPICDSVLYGCPEDLRPEYKASTKTYEFKNGSKLKLIGIDKNPNALRGNSIDLLIVDEAAFISNLKYLYESIIVPATANRKFQILFPSTPPEDSEHYWLKLVEQAKINNTYITRTIEDNTEIDEKERQRLLDAVGGEQSVTAQREFYCRVVRDENTTVIPEFNAQKHVKAISTPEFYNPQSTLDLGGAVDKTGIIIHCYDFKRDQILILESKLLPNNTPSNVVMKEVLALERKWYGEREVDRIADCAGQTRVDLAVLGLPTRAPKKEKDSVKANVNEVRIAFHNSRMEINQGTNDDLILTLELGQWKDGKEDFKRSERLGHLDLLAALLYAHRETSRGNPYPEWHNRDRINQHGHRTNKKTNFLLPNL